MPRKKRGRMRCQQVACLLRRDWLLAHHTATLPGVAALPERPLALARLQRFKQRKAPFLLLISPALASRIRVRKWMVWRSRRVRQWIARRWPGSTTLLLPASLRAPAAAVHRGTIALRMVEDNATQRLLARTGGVLYSSSLNRRGASPQMPVRSQRWRLISLQGVAGSGLPSSLVNLCGIAPKNLR